MTARSDWRTIARALAAAGDPGTGPRFCSLAGRPAATYSATQFTRRRDAVEALPADGVLVVYVRPTSETPFVVALTRADAERGFPGAFRSGSWDTVRYYNRPQVPKAAAPYVLPDGGPGRVREGRRPRDTR